MGLLRSNEVNVPSPVTSSIGKSVFFSFAVQLLVFNGFSTMKQDIDSRQSRQHIVKVLAPRSLAQKSASDIHRIANLPDQSASRLISSGKMHEGSKSGEITIIRVNRLDHKEPKAFTARS